MYRQTVVIAVAAALAGACARVASPLGGNGETGGGGVGGGGGGVPGSADVDLATPSTVADLGVAADLATRAAADLAVAADLAMPPPDLAPPGAVCHPVINEVQTGTSATGTEEFVELYNPCSAAVTISGWKLVYRAAGNTNARSGTDSATLLTLPTGSLAAGAYRVYAGSGFKGTADGTLGGGVAASGAVGLRDGNGAIVDSVAFGSVAGNTFIEGSAAPLPPTLASPGGSIQRLPNGSDSDDNGHDFATASQATPGAANH